MQNALFRFVDRRIEPRLAPISEWCAPAESPEPAMRRFHASARRTTASEFPIDGKRGVASTKGYLA